jgi:hypothetical protein
MKKILFTVFAAGMLVACAQTLQSPIVMKNPKTGEVAQCSTANMYGEILKTPTVACSEAYEKAGWINLTQPKEQP